MQLIAQPVYLGLEPVPLLGHDIQHRSLVLDHFPRQLGGITEHHASNSLSIQAIALVLLAGGEAPIANNGREDIED